VTYDHQISGSPGPYNFWFSTAADSLRYTSAGAVALAVFFIVIVVGITGFKLVKGIIHDPAWFPHIGGFSSFWNLFTAVPVLVCAYLCHYNGAKKYLYLSLL